jgi:hypothetical protein
MADKLFQTEEYGFLTFINVLGSTEFKPVRINGKPIPPWLWPGDGPNSGPARCYGLEDCGNRATELNLWLKVLTVSQEEYNGN